MAAVVIGATYSANNIVGVGGHGINAASHDTSRIYSFCTVHASDDRNGLSKIHNYMP